jgi:fido (protein-threonine AMPylation protein)
MGEDIFSRYNREDIIHSMYFYPDCDVLMNKLGIKEEKVLTAIEEDLTNQRLAELITRLKISPTSTRWRVPI